MHVVIVGSGPAGISAAEELRRRDSAAEITVLSGEPFPPYAPPALADHFLTGRDETLFWKGSDVTQRLGLDYRPGVVVSAVTPDQRTVGLADGTALRYDRLVIASGSRLYAPLEGYALPGVYNFKSLTAANALVARVRDGSAHTALVVGAGFIGVEIALLLRELGLAVTMIEMLDRVMPRMLDPETAEIVLAAMRERGIDVRLQTKALAFEGEQAALGVRLETGETITADLYVAATGVKPNVDFLADSGLDVGWGIRVDEHLRTSAPDVYAAGDVAETADRLGGERYVHAIFPNAVAQGLIVGACLAGEEAVYEGAESMNSLKHVGVPVIAVGAMSGERELRLRRDGVLRKVFLDGGRIVGFRLAGDISGAGFLHSLMNRATDVSAFGDSVLEPSFGVGRTVPVYS
jgi:NADPH-dependent 2,4-dienoyl-CoA reductase/sulfur reductase-like enzyme